MAYNKQAKKADYDQSIAGQAIATFTDFMALYPDDPRVADATRIITSLRTVEAQGNFRIAQYYEKQKKVDGALVYYNEVLLSDAGSPLAIQARQRIDNLKKRAPVHSCRFHRSSSHPPRRPNNMRAWLLIILAIAVGGCAGYKLGPTNGAAAAQPQREIPAICQ